MWSTWPIVPKKYYWVHRILILIYLKSQLLTHSKVRKRKIQPNCWNSERRSKEALLSSHHRMRRRPIIYVSHLCVYWATNRGALQIKSKVLEMRKRHEPSRRPRWQECCRHLREADTQSSVSSAAWRNGTNPWYRTSRKFTDRGSPPGIRPPALVFAQSESKLAAKWG